MIGWSPQSDAEGALQPPITPHRTSPGEETINFAGGPAVANVKLLKSSSKVPRLRKTDEWLAKHKPLSTNLCMT